MTLVLRAQADQLRLQSGLSFSVRIGLNSGEVVVGTIGKIGDDLRMDYTAQGYVVGLASRMEQICEPGRVYLTEHTARLVDGYFELRDLGETRVKGVSRPIRVHELLGVGALRTRFDLSRAHGLSRFVGRQTVPLLPVLELFRSYFGINHEDDDRTAREKIAGRMLLMDPGFADVLPLMFDFLGVPDAARPAPEMSGDARQQALFGVMRRFASVQSQQPESVVFLLEDLRW